MKLTDYTPDDQLYFLKLFNKKFELISQKVTEETSTKLPDSFLLSQLINTK
tara:strand:- start:6176 stop:6328 length:153 start_codon:yes stop_codon:yes gene_type:complete